MFNPIYEASRFAPIQINGIDFYPPGRNPADREGHHPPTYVRSEVIGGKPDFRVHFETQQLAKAMFDDCAGPVPTICASAAYVARSRYGTVLHDMDTWA